MFALFVFVSSAELLDRRFITLNGRFTGDWEIGENATIDNAKDGILEIVPASGKTTGFAWFSHRLSHSSWKTEVVMSFAKGVTSSRVGIWFTKDYGAFGPAFGGPLKFKGASVLVYFNGTTIEIEVRESDGRSKFTEFDFFPTFRCQLVVPEFSLSCEQNAERLRVEIKCDGKSEVVFSEKPRTKTKKPWMSVTAQNGKNGGSVYVESAVVDGAKTVVETLKIERRQGFLQILPNVARNGEAVDVMDVIASVDELVSFMDPVANSTYIVEHVRASLLPFTEKWQRRSLSIVNETAAFREKLINELKGSSEMVEELRNDVDTAFKELKESVHDIETELYFGVLKGHDLDRHIRQAKKAIVRDRLPRTLIILSVLETSVVFIFVVFRLVAIN